MRIPPKKTPHASPSTISKLPFERSLIIFYGAPGKSGNSPATTAAESAKPSSSVVPESKEIRREKVVGNARPSDVKAVKTQPSPANSNGGVGLQSVIIYYRGSQPLATTVNTNPSIAPPDAASADSSEPSFKRDVPGDSHTAPQEPEPFANPLVKVALTFAPVEAWPDNIMTEIVAATPNTKLPEEPIRIAAANKQGEDAVKNTDKPLNSPQANDATAVAARVSGTANSAAVEESSSSNKTTTIPVEPRPTEMEGPNGSGNDKSSVSDVPPTSAPPVSASTLSSESGDADTGPTSGAVKLVKLPENVVDLNNTAVQRTLEYNYAEAETLLLQAIKEQPNVAKFYRNLSIVYEKMKRIDDALASARIGVKLAPSEPSILEQLCALEVVAKNAGNGLSCYEKLKAIEPLDVLGQTYYGVALFESGRPDEALGILEKAAQTTPQFSDALNALGVIYYAQKRLKDAIAAFKSAVEASPDQSGARYNLAVAELANRNKAAAISQYNIIKSVDARLADQLYRIIYGDKLLFADEVKDKKH
jgi:Tfp pilus assembly protein PilF